MNVPKDFLIVHSTTPYRSSTHGSKVGSWFLNELRQAFDKLPYDDDVNILELLTVTNAAICKRTRVAHKYEGTEKVKDPDRSGHKQTLSISHRLSSDLVFTKKRSDGPPAPDNPNY